MIGAGEDHVCVVLNKIISCWQDPDLISTNTFDKTTVPYTFATNPNDYDVLLSTYAHTNCAIFVSKPTIDCWGENKTDLNNDIPATLLVDDEEGIHNISVGYL
jgi:hypothetical protein